MIHGVFHPLHGAEAAGEAGAGVEVMSIQTGIEIHSSSSFLKNNPIRGFFYKVEPPRGREGELDSKHLIDSMDHDI